ncbi:MAG: hypothetical protein JWN14_2335, partial [Chthonomonadales bacterium]|nr:hypothetical protein [Chthonomonadales bacterium]
GERAPIHPRHLPSSPPEYAPYTSQTRIEVVNVNQDSAEEFTVQQACLVAAHTENYIRNGVLIFLVWPESVRV